MSMFPSPDEDILLYLALTGGTGNPENGVAVRRPSRIADLGRLVVATLSRVVRCWPSKLVLVLEMLPFVIATLAGSLL